MYKFIHTNQAQEFILKAKRLQRFWERKQFINTNHFRQTRSLHRVPAA
jgi:hypothetical protein